MPPGILSSHLITVDSLNVLLTSVAAQEPTYKFQLLSTKLAILTNRPSQPVHRSFESELQILQCRVDIARAALELVVPKLVLAGEELGVVERDCKGIMKRMCRQERVRSDKAAIKSGDGGVLERNEIVGVKEDSDSGVVAVAGEKTSTLTSGSTSISTSTRPAPTPLPTESVTTTATATTSTISTTSSTSSVSKYQARQRTITALRVEALRLLGEVEEMQGRPERRGRWDSLALRLEAG